MDSIKKAQVFFHWFMNSSVDEEAQDSIHANKSRDSRTESSRLKLGEYSKRLFSSRYEAYALLYHQARPGSRETEGPLYLRAARSLILKGGQEETEERGGAIDERGIRSSSLSSALRSELAFTLLLTGLVLRVISNCSSKQISN